MVEKRDGRSESPNRCEVLVAMFSFKTQTKPHAKKNTVQAYRGWMDKLRD